MSVDPPTPPPAPSAPPVTPAPPAPSPWRDPDFRRLFAAAAVSKLGTQIGYVALPLVAVLVLDAGPGEVGMLATLSTVAFLLIGLPAGAWVDRLRRRRLMILADLLRAALLASVPACWALDLLTLTQLYVVVLLSGCATVFFDVAALSHLPQLVHRDALVAANAGMVGLDAAGSVAGRGAGGSLVQLVSAPAAVAADAVSYLVSALSLARIRKPEPAPPPRSAVEGGGPGLWPQIREGLSHVLGSPRLRALALGGALTNLGAQLVNTMLPVLFTRELGLSATALGLFWSAGGVGVLLGSRCARPLARRFGYGRTLGVVGLVVAPAGLLLPLLDTGGWLWAAGAGWLLTTAKVGVDNVLAVSLRQRMTPDGLLGRMNATFRFLLTGALAVGSGLAGLLGAYVSVRAALWAGGICLALVWLPVLLSPLRSLRDLPDGPQQLDGPRHPDGPPTRVRA
ncbi:MFS transporter [Streptomyces sp. N2-109]|uniref:MFS transporter n=1 Tax=Streptomyces gossypii TaxID=2883101 RepID=A0ABT2JS97_9ACTN|nr:MFS transporter [Streptomyces gossypii]MCT2590583.1 MFS transporter [Streptomyces gossypii]